MTDYTKPHKFERDGLYHICKCGLPGDNPLHTAKDIDVPTKPGTKTMQLLKEHPDTNASNPLVKNKDYIAGYNQALINQRQELVKQMEGMRKPDLNLKPGFNITAEYRLGEIRGYNQALDDINPLKEI